MRNTIDLLIAMQAIRYGMKLLHNDRDFEILAEVAKELEFYNC